MAGSDRERWTVKNHRSKTAVIWSDTHASQHDKDAIKLAAKITKSIGPDIFIHLGDAINCDAFSPWIIDPRAVGSFESECDDFVHDIIRPIDLAAPKAERHFIAGNHDEWLYRWACKNAPQLVYSKRWALSSLLGLDQFGFKLHSRIMPYNHDPKAPYLPPEPLRLGSLYLMHGHEEKRLATGNRVNIAKAYLQFFNCNLIIGHWHKSQQDSIVDMKGDVRSCWVASCLQGKQVSYSMLPQWTQGIIAVDFYEKFFHVEPINFLREKGRGKPFALWHGKLYE